MAGDPYSTRKGDWANNCAGDNSVKLRERHPMQNPLDDPMSREFRESGIPYSPDESAASPAAPRASYDDLIIAAYPFARYFDVVLSESEEPGNTPVLGEVVISDLWALRQYVHRDERATDTGGNLKEPKDFYAAMSKRT